MQPLSEYMLNGSTVCLALYMCNGGQLNRYIADYCYVIPSVIFQAKCLYITKRKCIADDWKINLKTF